MMESHNPILFADSYKISHHKQYPPGITYIKAYFESRGGLHPETAFFGLQYIIKRYLCTSVTSEHIDEAEALLNAHFNGVKVFNRAGWERVVKHHGGKLPIRISAVPEGSLVPVKNVLFVVESTDEELPWMANFVETAMVQFWYPLTVATNSLAQRRVIFEYMKRTGGDIEMVDFQLHDFGFRGSTSRESAGLGGAAHLTSFKGSDTLEALQLARHFYGPSDLVAGHSIPATEHSTMTTWGKDLELEAMQHMLKEFPLGMLSVVSDSYDLWNFLENIIGSELKDQIQNRDGTLVIRPDSGDPVEVVLKVLTILESKFGSVKNPEGFKMLPSFIKVIQGDGISYQMIVKILSAMEKEGWCAQNVVFGSGGALLQKMDRDTQKCAYKCCMAIINGKEVEVYKDPITDPGKTSKKGDITLVRNKETGKYRTCLRKDLAANEEDALVPIYENGRMLREYTFDEVRARLKAAAGL